MPVSLDTCCLCRESGQNQRAVEATMVVVLEQLFEVTFKEYRDKLCFSCYSRVQNLISWKTKFKGGHTFAPLAPKKMQFNLDDHAQKLLSQMWDLYQTRQLCDFILLIEDEEIHVHKAVLVSQCQMFKSLLDSQVLIGDQCIVPDTDLDIARQLIDFMYTGQLSLKRESMERVHSLASAWGINGATQLCDDYRDMVIKQASTGNSMSFENDQSVQTEESKGEPLEEPATEEDKLNDKENPAAAAAAAVGTDEAHEGDAKSNQKRPRKEDSISKKKQKKSDDSSPRTSPRRNTPAKSNDVKSKKDGGSQSRDKKTPNEKKTKSKPENCSLCTRPKRTRRLPKKFILAEDLPSLESKKEIPEDANTVNKSEMDSVNADSIINDEHLVGDGAAMGSAEGDQAIAGAVLVEAVPEGEPSISSPTQETRFEVQVIGYGEDVKEDLQGASSIIDVSDIRIDGNAFIADIAELTGGLSGDGDGDREHEVSVGSDIKMEPGTPSAGEDAGASPVKRKRGRPKTQFSKFQECDLCGKKMINLKRHMLRHKGYQFHCDKCPAQFYEEYELKKHLEIRHGAPVVCDQCGKEFRSRTAIHRHMLVSHNVSRDVSYFCEQCSRVFACRELLEGHMNMHTGAKPHLCSKCNRGFAYLASLKAHVVDCGKSNYLCNICGYAFTHVQARSRHIKSKHEGATFSCRYCGKVFPWLRSRQKHEKTVHKDVKVKMEQVLWEVVLPSNESGISVQ